MAIHPPAFCPIHGFFPATGFNIEGVQHSTFIGCLDQCRQCRRMCEIVPGVYDRTSEGLNLIVDPSVSRETLLALSELSERVRNNELSIKDAKIEAEKIDPKAKGFFSGWSEQSKVALAVAAIGAIALVAAAKVSDSPNTTVIVNPVVERVVRKVVGLQKTSQPSPRPSKPQSETPEEGPYKKPENGH